MARSEHLSNQIAHNSRIRRWHARASVRLPSPMQRVAIANPSDGGLIYWLFKLYVFAVCAGLMALVFVGVGVYLHFCRELPPLPDLTTYASTAPGMTTLYGAGRHAPGRAVDGAARDRPARPRAAAAHRRLLVDRRSPLLLARRLRRARPRARARRQPARRRRQAGRLDHHAAGGQGVPLVGAHLVAQDQGADLRAPPRGAAIRSARSCRSTSTTSSSATAPTACRRRRARYFDKDVAELDLGQQALIAGLAQAPSRYSPFVDEEAALQAARRGARQHGRERRARRAPRPTQWKAAPLQRAAAARLLPRGHALLHGAGAPRSRSSGSGRRPSTKAAIASRRPCCPTSTSSRRTTSTTPRASSTSGRAGAAPRRGSTTPTRPTFRKRARRALRQGAARRGQALPRPRREGERRRRAAVRVGAHSLPAAAREHAVGGAVLGVGRDQRQADHRRRRGAQAHDVIWVRWALHSRIPRFTDFTYNEEGDATWMPEQLEPKKPPKAQELHARADAARAGLDLRLRSSRRLRAGDGRRRRLRSLGVQPRDAGVPPAGLGLQADLLLAGARSRLRLRHDVERQAQGRGRSDDGRAVDPAERRRQLQRRRSRSSARWCGRRTRRPSRSSTSSAPRTSRRWAKRLGITTPLVTNAKCEKEFCSSLALGASCVHIDDMTRAFAVFARNGKPIEPVIVRRVIDRTGPRRRGPLGVGRSVARRRRAPRPRRGDDGHRADSR